jgi:two-component system sensor kinase FixL
MAAPAESAQRTGIELEPFAALVEEMSEFACLVSQRGKPQYVNPAGRRLIGLEASEDLAARSMRDFFTPDTWSRLRAEAFPQVKAAGRWAGTGQLRHVQVDAALDVEISLSVVRSPQTAKPSRLALVAREACDHRQIEEALRESQALYSSLVENLPLNVLRKDLDGRFTFGNCRYFETVGQPAGDVLGKTDFDFFPRELAEKYRADDQRVLETGQTFEAVERHQMPDGSMHFVQVWKTPLRDAAGQIVGTQAIFWDVTDHHRAEEALQESEARKAAILESSLDGIITVDQQGRICEFNRAAERMFGRPRAQVLGKDPADILFPSDASAGHHDRLGRYIAQGSGSMLGRRMEVVAVRAGGQKFPAEMAMTISRLQGEPVFTFFLRDISERKQAEEARARHAAELARSNADLQQFAFAASHDLQEPLRKILAFGDRLKIKCADALSDDGRLYLERMQNAARRMQELIHGLLELSRVTTKGSQFERVDLNEIAQQVMTDLEVRVEQLAGRVELGRLPVIEADPVQMRQLLQNLIGNGLKFYPPGRPPHVEVLAQEIEKPEAAGPGMALVSGPWCRIVVRDHGIGFDEKQSERIFAVFQRLHTRDEYEGAGLGLAICRKIAQRHHGTIVANSSPGHGATFTVTLPMRHSEAVAD